MSLTEPSLTVGLLPPQLLCLKKSPNPTHGSGWIPVKVCGDTSAEANESFRVNVTNVSGATIIPIQIVGTIIDDDILELALEDSGPNPDQAAAMDATIGVRDPFRVVGIPDWIPNVVDRNTRIALFARNLQLNPGELSSAVVVRFTHNGGQIFEVPAQDVRLIANSDLTQVVVRLPNNMLTGTWTVFIRAHMRVTNTGTIRIAP